MGFSEPQTRLLAGKLSRKHVRTRELDGRTLSYVEGWHVIAEANRIFGFDGWDREMVWSACVWEDGRRDPKACAYAARVRIRVRAGDITIARDGSGVGHGIGSTMGEAHESALKEAETDAMKRALITFGNSFGLALYDKEQTGVRGGVKVSGDGAPLGWVVLSADGHIIATCSDPKSFCSRLRQVFTACSDADLLRGVWNRNAAIIGALRDHRPDLVTRKGIHFAVLLEQVFEQQLKNLTDRNSAATASIPVNEERSKSLVVAVDKTALALPTPKRVRDRVHLEYVATLPCIVCGRTPTQAHHLRFTQPRALGLKVSDEWAVPLCNLHHRAIHDVGDEESWWKQQSIEVSAEAERLWREHRLVDHRAEEIDGVPNSNTQSTEA